MVCTYVCSAHTGGVKQQLLVVKVIGEVAVLHCSVYGVYVEYFDRRGTGGEGRGVKIHFTQDESEKDMKCRYQHICMYCMYM